MTQLRWCARLGLLVALGFPGEQGGAQEEARVEDYVRQVFVHGVPYSASRVWSAEHHTTRLIEMLADEAERTRWTTIVAVLGIVGHDHAFCPLVEFLSRDVASVPPGEAGLTVPLAFGYLVNSDIASGKTTPAGEAALGILVRGVEPEFWVKAWPPALEAVCRSPRGPSAGAIGGDTGRALARRSVLGLVLSGHQSAVERLQLLSDSVASGGDAEALFSDFFPEMLETAGAIAKGDLATYYGE